MILPVFIDVLQNKSFEIERQNWLDFYRVWNHGASGKISLTKKDKERKRNLWCDPDEKNTINESFIKNKQHFTEH